MHWSYCSLALSHRFIASKSDEWIIWTTYHGPWIMIGQLGCDCDPHWWALYVRPQIILTGDKAVAVSLEQHMQMALWFLYFILHHLIVETKYDRILPGPLFSTPRNQYIWEVIHTIAAIQYGIIGYWALPHSPSHKLDACGKVLKNAIPISSGQSLMGRD